LFCDQELKSEEAVAEYMRDNRTHVRLDEGPIENWIPYRAEVLSVPFTCCSFDDILSAIGSTIAGQEIGHAICITNTESMYHALRLPDHLRFIQNADFSCCDGVGVVLAGKMLGYNIPRLHGPDLMIACCEYGIEKTWRHFFYGGKEGIPELLARNLTEKFPGLITAGTYSPPFRPLTPEEDEEIVSRINSAQPDIIWVGLGLLKQEKWISDHINRIKAPWMIGVGAAFDFHAGTIKRAPVAFQKVGLEWLYRLAFEPRMFVRNVRSFSILGNAAKEAIRKHFERGTKND
jgi:N-acetylglucosaminyldiphosphoundecaprenol N-acetyl-beta-D-mannosaminyltransferase